MTIALPILISHYKYDDDYFIDGGISENFAIERLKDKLLYTIGISLDNYKINFENIKNLSNNKDIISYLKYLFDLINIFSSKTKFTSTNNTI